MPELDQAQYDTGIGPCLQAFRDGVAYRIDCTKTDTTFEAFSTRCAQHGILSTLSLPMVVNQETWGAFNLYSHTEGAFSPDDQRGAEQFSGQAAIVAGNAHAYWEAHQLSQDLNAVRCAPERSSSRPRG